jgi:hypothetical protein
MVNNAMDGISGELEDFTEKDGNCHEHNWKPVFMLSGVSLDEKKRKV